MKLKASFRELALCILALLIVCQTSEMQAQQPRQEPLSMQYRDAEEEHPAAAAVRSGKHLFVFHGTLGAGLVGNAPERVQNS